MATSEAQEIKKKETLLRFSIISYKTRLHVLHMSISKHLEFSKFKIGLFEFLEASNPIIVHR